MKDHYLFLMATPSKQTHSIISFFFLASLVLCFSCSGCTRTLQEPSSALTLEAVRKYLSREEDSIVFSLIERAKYPFNSPAYDPRYVRPAVDGCENPSIAELVVREMEAVQAETGRYRNPEELPFFPDDLPMPLVPPYRFPKELHPAATSVNVSKSIWNLYFNNLLQLFTTKGDDGNYGSTVASDLVCLQALSRRIHYGRFVAEVKFRDAPQDYLSAIHAKDKNTLMKLVTSEIQEEMVVKRVEKKAMVFGQDVTLETKVDMAGNGSTLANYKVDPLVIARLYKEWVIPLTKIVEVKYLLHRLD